MNVFDYALMANDERTTVCFNKKRYTKEEAFKLGKEELLNHCEFKEFEIRTGFVKLGYYKACEGEVHNGWSISFSQNKREDKTDVEVWVVEGMIL